MLCWYPPCRRPRRRNVERRPISRQRLQPPYGMAWRAPFGTAAMHEANFVADSLLEERRFEPSVPRRSVSLDLSGLVQEAVDLFQ